MPESVVGGGPGIYTDNLMVRLPNKSNLCQYCSVNVYSIRFTKAEFIAGAGKWVFEAI